MQVALTNSSATTKGFFSKASDDLLPPISLTKDTLNWPLVHDPEGEVNLEVCASLPRVRPSLLAHTALIELASFL